MEHYVSKVQDNEKEEGILNPGLILGTAIPCKELYG
jgi:hypothetical protein